MRTLIVAAALFLAACNDAPEIEILAPTPDTVITDHAGVPIELLVTDDNIRSIELQLDGTVFQLILAENLPNQGECDAGCEPTTLWGATEATEGTHTLTAVITDEFDEVATAELAITFEDVPTATFSAPVDPAQIGVAQIPVAVNIVDRGEITAELLLDGEPVPDAALTGNCLFGCQLSWPFDTAPLAGEHVLDVNVTDQDGRSTTATQSIVLGDLPFATAIEITNTSDTGGFTSLDVEIHLRDADTDAWIGCAGENQGMENVDDSNVRYDVLAHFVDSTGARLEATALAGRNLEFVVMEDDDFQCPNPLDLSIDDQVGISAPIPVAELPGHAPLTFGNVVELDVDLGRPY